MPLDSRSSKRQKHVGDEAYVVNSAPMRIIRAAAQVVQPWKNGGGTTREIAKAPATASFDGFDWRVSRAHVASDGPFSRFDGIDRTLLVLTGEGLRLEFANSTPVTLAPQSEPFSFRGDDAVDASLISGPIDDLNVMTRRERFRHCVERRRLTSEATIHAAGDALVVFVESGALLVGAERVGADDVLVCEPPEELVVRAAPEVLVVVVDLFRVT